MLIYDVEIAKAVQGKGETRLDGVQYCKGWTDYAGMGVACVCAFDVNEARYRVFMQDNLLAFGELARSHDWVLGFNSITFDDNVMRAAGVEWPAGKSMDLARLIWKAAGFCRRAYGGRGRPPARRERDRPQPRPPHTVRRYSAAWRGAVLRNSIVAAAATRVNNVWE